MLVSLKGDLNPIIRDANSYSSHQLSTTNVTILALKLSEMHFLDVLEEFFLSYFIQLGKSFLILYS